MFRQPQKNNTVLKPGHSLLFVLIMALMCQCSTNNNESGLRQKFNFNQEWKVKVADDSAAADPLYADQDWKEVTLPYAWNQDEAFKNDIRELSTGIAWYRKHFQLPAEYKDRKVFIEFEGVRHAAMIFVNGDSIGLHENGINAFAFDITDHLHYGEKKNVIAVRTDNAWDYREHSSNSRYQWNDKNFNANYGGINKNVVLHVTGKVHQTLPIYTNLGTTGTYVYAEDIDVANKSAKIHVKTQVTNAGTSPAKLSLEVNIKDLEGTVIHSMKGDSYELAPGATQILKTAGQVNDLQFWSWGYGYLYDVETILKRAGEVIDKVTTTTGFRKTAFENGMVKLNDRVLMMKGYAQRTTNEWPGVGISVPPWLSDYSNGLMVASNANLVRWMHTTPSKQDVESCDRVGLLQAMPAGDAEGDVRGRRWEHRKTVMRDAIIYNRNNPSIIFYECGNDGISEAHMLEMKAIRDQYDPYGGRAIGSREMLDSEAAEYGGEMLYINKSDDKPVWAMEYMRDEALRKYWDEYSPPYHKNGEGPDYKGRPARAYNQNQDAYAYQIVRRWYEYFRERPGTGDRVSSGGVNIIFSGTNTHHRGAENYRRSGETDPLRIPKDGFYAHQVMWDGWVEVENHRTHIVGHWNYEPGTVKPVYVVSSGDRVELFIDDEFVGDGRREHGFMYVFDSVEFKVGEIKAVSYDKEGEVLSQNQITTAGPAERIKLSVMHKPGGMIADGADLALIQVEVVDKNGQRCPLAFDTIHFELTGPADWIGGMAQGPGNLVGATSLPVECGVNRVLVRSKNIPGEIKLTAKANGLIDETAEISTSEFNSTRGLNTRFPAQGLPLNLERGPTPEGKSYSVTRKNVKIVSATAGANEENVEYAFDGKQTTRWVNDGKLETGWIDLQLEKEAPVSEIALKLSGWRTRSYPIVVQAGEEVVYMGLTQPNLGFFYIEPEKEIITDHLKIRLFGQTEFNDVYKLVEITGKLDKETANDLAVNNATSLNIVEVEVFEEP